MNDWYCARKFPIPFNVPVILRGMFLAEYEGEEHEPVEGIVEITEWCPLDGLEPKPKQELHDATK